MSEVEEKDLLEEGKENQENGSAKVEKKYRTAMNNLEAMLNGDKSPLRTTKVGNDGFSEIVAEVIKERKQKATDKFKKDLGEVFDAVVEFNKLEKQKEAEFRKAIDEGKKVLTAKINALTGQLEDINSMVKNYYSSLKKEETETPAST